jgi:dTMP kinase
MKHALIYPLSKRHLLAEPNDGGLLIAFEGLDGSGKSTQRKLIKSWLKSEGERVVTTKWSSSPLFKPIIKAKKAARLLDPIGYAKLHAEDFWHRYETLIEPALAAGKIVLADRYVFTGIARDTARGMSSERAMELYRGARRPDLVFYFRAPVETCASRILESRELKFYEAGQDVTGLNDAPESYLRFAPRVVSQYERLHQEYDFVIVDAKESIYDQHSFIRETYLSRCHRLPTQRVPGLKLHALLSRVDV